MSGWFNAVKIADRFVLEQLKTKIKIYIIILLIIIIASSSYEIVHQCNLKNNTVKIFKIFNLISLIITVIFCLYMLYGLISRYDYNFIMKHPAHVFMTLYVS